MSEKTLQSSVDAVVTVPGVCSGEPFQTVSGGEVSSETVKDREPGGKFGLPIAAPPEIGNVTVSRTWNEDRDRPLKSKLDAAVSFVENATVGKIVRDKHGNRRGMDTYSPCVLVRVTGPDGDTNNTSEKATLELEFAAGGIS